MAGSGEAIAHVTGEQPRARRGRRRRFWALALCAVFLIAGFAVWLVLGLGSTSPASLASYYPHRPVFAQGTGNATVPLPPVSGRVSVTLRCRDSRVVQARFTRQGRFMFEFATFCVNGVGTDTLPRGVPWPDKVTVTSAARHGQWVLIAASFDHLRSR